MKIYTIVERSLNYNDEYYYFEGGGTPLKQAWKSEEKAREEMARLNEEAKGRYDEDSFEDGEHEDFYEIAEIDVEEDEVTYASALEKVQAARVEMQRMAQGAFNEAAKEIFDKYPKLESFGWKQYQPYFCDGDPCHFSVYYDEESLIINDTNASEFPYDKKYNIIYPEGLEGVGSDIEKLLATFNESDMEDMFGGDNSITVYRNGTIDSEEYGDHD